MGFLFEGNFDLRFNLPSGEAKYRESALVCQRERPTFSFCLSMHQKVFLLLVDIRKKHPVRREEFVRL
jgi:hypothetical protein